MCEEGFKKCSKCGEVKPFSEFRKNSAKCDNRSNTCKVCQRKRDKELNEAGRSEWDKWKYGKDHYQVRDVENYDDRIAHTAETLLNFYNDNLQQIEKTIYKDYSRYECRDGFGTMPINEEFEGAEFHHLHIGLSGEKNKDIGIFIPYIIHQTTWHSSKSWIGMDDILDNIIEWYNKNVKEFGYIESACSQKSLFEFY